MKIKCISFFVVLSICFSLFNNIEAIVLILNGATCTGKTSLSRAFIKKISNVNWMHYGFDQYLLENHNNGGPKCIFSFWKEKHSNGRNIIADAALYSPFTLRKMYKNIKKDDICLVKVYCSKSTALKRLEKRNKSSNKFEHRYKFQLERHFDNLDLFHKNKKYDLEINTNDITPDEAVTELISYLKKHFLL